VTPTLRSTGEIFDDEYYRIHCDDPAHPRSAPEWPNFFQPIADAIVLGLAPRKVFDAGCAAGFLAEKLWDRGVETHGRDISELAISQVRADVRPWCEVGSIAEPIAHADGRSPCFNPKYYRHRAPDPFLGVSYRPGRSHMR
jgi:hypothetical protein